MGYTTFSDTPTCEHHEYPMKICPLQILWEFCSFRKTGFERGARMATMGLMIWSFYFSMDWIEKQLRLILQQVVLLDWCVYWWLYWWILISQDSSCQKKIYCCYMFLYWIYEVPVLWWLNSALVSEHFGVGVRVYFFPSTYLWYNWYREINGHFRQLKWRYLLFLFAV